MADVEIRTDVDNEFMDDGDQGVQKLKNSVTKRKGRGFGDTSFRPQDEMYDSITGGCDGGADAPQRSIEGWILFVRNVNQEASEDDLRDKFRDFGEIKNIHVNVDRRTGFLKGYALVEYENFKEAQNALKEIDGAELNGEQLKVNWAFVQGTSGRRVKSARDRLGKQRDRSRSRSPRR
ncbi:RNA-binding protein 8A [Cichlidogyrus casuarinus]|uniref:RNA-binding protein 8A n=1 Tax=Cichlidogyrus casuarinus TaxID=1844966 RepID=A0ABD2QAC7_9PLAT